EDEARRPGGALVDGEDHAGGSLIGRTLSASRAVPPGPPRVFPPPATVGQAIAGCLLGAFASGGESTPSSSERAVRLRARHRVQHRPRVQGLRANPLPP